MGHRRALDRGEVLFASGDDNDLCATLVSGVLKVSSFDADGTEHIVSLIHPAGFVGELFTPVAHHDTIALTDCEVCLFPRERYEQALRRFPELAGALLRRSSAEVVESRLLLGSIAGRSAEQRLASLLLQLARAASDSECHDARRFDLVLTRGEMASLLGLTIETVSRQLTRLEGESVIAKDGTRGIRITDPARLSQLAA